MEKARAKLDPNQSTQQINILMAPRYRRYKLPSLYQPCFQDTDNSEPLLALRTVNSMTVMNKYLGYKDISILLVFKHIYVIMCPVYF